MSRMGWGSCARRMRSAVAWVVTSGIALGIVCGIALSAVCVAGRAESQPPAPSAKALQVFFIDVEGGQATLFVTPDKHSLLIDTGWSGHDGRDADRIVHAMEAAHITRLDAVLITHYHLDHVGGVEQLVKRVPVGMFLDHGPNREATTGDTQAAREAYDRLIASGRYAHHVMRAGQRLPVHGFRARVVSADGQLIDHALPGADGLNPFCLEDGKPIATPQADKTENARSVGILMEWGRARILDLGDLTQDKEVALMCPRNKLGRVDLLVVSHHGWYQSSNPALVHAIDARVAVMDNGAEKGGSVPVLETFLGKGPETSIGTPVETFPGSAQAKAGSAPVFPSGALWQLHFSKEGGTAHNTAVEQIANLPYPAEGTDLGHAIRVEVRLDGGMTVWNGRTGQSIDYAAAGATH